MQEGKKLMMMEFCSGENLYQTLQQPQNYCGLPEQQLCRILTDIGQYNMHMALFSVLYGFYQHSSPNQATSLWTRTGFWEECWYNTIAHEKQCHKHFVCMLLNTNLTTFYCLMTIDFKIVSSGLIPELFITLRGHSNVREYISLCLWINENISRLL